MSKITLSSLSNLQNETTAVNTINTNSTTIQTAMDNTLSRDGTSPNQMGASLDMNSNRIFNLPTPATANEPLRFSDLSSFTGGGTVTNIPAGGTNGQVLAKSSSTDYAVHWIDESSDLAAGTNIAITGTTPATISTVANPTFATSVTTPLVNGITITPNTGVLTLNTNTLAVSGSGSVLTLAGPTGTLTFQGTQTYIGRGSIDTLTNKTFDTAGTGNVLQINGTTVSAVTGTGSVVLANTPTLITPVLGVATATTINKVTITPVAGNSALTIINGKTLTANNTVSLSGPDGTTITYQGSDTYVGRATTDTFTNKTYDTAGTGNSFLINGVAVTANTGTGAVARAASPTFTTPTLGAATATTINGISITASSGTLTLNANTFAVAGAGISVILASGGSGTLSFQGTDTYVGRATTDTLTNKTYDTAGTGNSFLINGLAATANTGTGSVVRATTPTLVTPVLGVATGTSITLGTNGGTGGSVLLNGSTSGSCNINVAAAAGTSTNFRLPATNGTNTFFLQTDGAGNTSWTAGGGTTTSGNRSLIATLTANNSATTLADTTSLTSSFNMYDIVIENLLPATNSNTLRLRVNVSGVQTTGYHSTVIAGAATDAVTTGIILSGTTNTISSTGTGYSGTIRVSAPSGTSFPKMFYGNGGYYTGAAGVPCTFAGQFDTNNNAVTGIQFDFTGGGNLVSGTVKIFGIVN